MSDELVPRDALKTFFGREAPQYAGDFTVERLGEGQSCLTFMVAGDGWRVVLRRPPRGDLPPSAFDVRREYRVMRALRDADSAVPTPRPVLLCEDKDVIGSNFYLMEPVDGIVVRQQLVEPLTTLDDRAQMSHELVDTLINLHAVDHEAIGLGGFGKPAGYLERQLQRMTQLWELARFRDLPDLEFVGKWLAEHIPADRGWANIVHGDYKLDNVMFAPSSPARIVAVVDWEMSTIGDPMADLGWMLYWWRDPGDSSFGLTVSSVMDQEGFPRRRDLLQRYAASSSRDVDGVRWYSALGGWKIAIIMEGSYRRFLAGIADHPMFKELEWGVPALAARARQAIETDFGL
jgi:aminoglycoside phosphotransferase (APT) family kinase protein